MATGADQGARLFAARVAEQRARVFALDAAVRAEEPDAVHQLRIACRRLRVALRAYGPAAAEPVEGLRRLGRALAPARDCEVVGELLVGGARELPAELGPERVAVWLERRLAERAARARGEVVAALASDWYAALLAGLDGLPGAAEPVDTPKRLARKAARKALVEPGMGEEELHRARKAAKRARYLGEVAGKERFTARMKARQELLGRYQDAVVARAALRELAGQPGADRFALGVLYGRQLAVAAEARARPAG
ncbi:CHAD domain-containing protein [Kitasatospora sp. MMS16-BH015]|uniref:CHAD domain-containing protein n=1 Tax=Kitasatospora sp. MMS16-BH015 TaxID=2018025 RepID=UPI000CA1EE07|nr:CHAD domain-containing protein [Kitasatospora sp. MMS16-BH015]AUG75586.1 CHAD domain-containing protein [Kitasatospora sp. MMS16-BH015]